MNDDSIIRNTASAGIPALPAIPAGEPPVSRDGVIRINLFYREHAEDAICTSDGVAMINTAICREAVGTGRVGA